MTSWSIPIPFLCAQGCAAFDEAGNALWLAGTDGTVATAGLLDLSVRVVGGGYQDPVAVVPLDDGLQVAVVERAGGVWAAARADAGRATARQVASYAVGAAGAALAADGRLVVLAADPAGSLHLLDAAGGGTEVLLADTGGAVAVATENRQGTVLLVVPGVAGQGATLRALTPATGDLVDVPLPGGTPAALSSAPTGPLGALLAEGMEVSAVALAGPPGPHLSLPGPVRALSRWGSMVLAVTETGVELRELDLDPGPMPVDMGPGPLFRGGYVTLRLDPAAVGLTADDIEIVVDEGPVAGTLSAGREVPDARGRHLVVLLAGMIPGEFHLRARSLLTGDLLASRRFRVTGCWPDQKSGPPIAITGEAVTYANGAWGGGGGAGPQNIPARPAPANWRVAVVLVTTKDNRYPGGPGASPGAWTARLVGAGRSARTYFEEVSFYDPAAPAGGRTGTTVSEAGNQVFGPLDLDYGWGDLFDPIDKAMPWRGWNPKPTTWQLIAGAFSDWLVDQPGNPGPGSLGAADAVVFAVRCGSAGPVKVGKDELPAEYVWPQASGSRFYWKSPTTYTQAAKAMVFMPDAFPVAMPVAEQLFEPTATLCHELGHTLGLDDLYNAGKLLTAEVEDRVANDLDLMCSSWSLPHLSLPNRMRLGWINPQWVEPVDFAANSAPRTIALRSVETTTKNGPPPGRRTGVEIRLRDGWNYYFEHRHPQPTQVGDQSLSSFGGDGRLVLGTDVHRPTGGEPTRPSVLLVPVDHDGDGPVLNAFGEDYEETDTSNPGRAFDFGLRYEGTDAADPEVVNVSLYYVAARRPQLQISPAPGGTDFKSPDIDLVGPAGVNALVKGAPHTVLVRVRNVGNVAAKDVLVRMKWLPFTTAAGTWNALPDPPRQSIPPGATRTFSVVWTPPQSLLIGDVEAEHFCLRVDVERYVDAINPAQNEITVFDNWAQSNFDSTSAPFNSPSLRRRTGVEMTNPLARSANFTTHIDQSSPWYRVYVGQAWQRLEPGERRAVQVMYESLAGDHDQGAAFDAAFEEGALREANHVALTSRLVPSDPARCASERPWWGAALQIRAARLCWFEDIQHTGELVSVAVLGGEPGGGGSPVTDGDVRLSVWSDDTEESFLLDGVFAFDGRSRVLLPGPVMELLQSGRELRALFARAETYWYARAVSPPFTLRL